mmetsp:Transcript_34963/g.96677  ORF Transcript_34963/g.96677 Transcript_34963/m.96677 type:complete len:218 (+) Transcript_34963:1056-1709(+)
MVDSELVVAKSADPKAPHVGLLGLFPREAPKDLFGLRVGIQALHGCGELLTPPMRHERLDRDAAQSILGVGHAVVPSDVLHVRDVLGLAFWKNHFLADLVQVAPEQDALGGVAACRATFFKRTACFRRRSVATATMPSELLKPGALGLVKCPQLFHGDAADVLRKELPTIAFPPRRRNLCGARLAGSIVHHAQLPGISILVRIHTDDLRNITVVITR